MGNNYTAPQFLNIIDKHQRSNVYFIHGQDHFLADKIIKQLISLLTTKDSREFDLINLFGDNINSEEIIEQLEMFPFLSDYKVVVVRSFDQLKDKDKRKVAEFIHKIPDTSIFITHCENIDLRTKVFKAFNNYITINAKPPAGYWEIEKWLSNELRKLKIRASQDTISLFSSKIEADYYTASNELKKILIYLGNRKVINREDVETCMENNRASSIFELQNAIGFKNKQRALSILHNFLEAEEGKNSILLIVMLTRFFQFIWKVIFLLENSIPSSDIQSNYLREIHYSFRKDYLTFARNYQNNRMSKIFDLLLESDYQLKSTDLEVNILLTKLVVDIIDS